MIKQTLINITILISFSVAANVTFNIDMTNLDFPNDNYDNVVINGEWDNWSGWGVTLSDNNEDA